MKSLLGILCLDRPKTIDKCLTQLLATDDRDDFTIIVVDNGSNDETKEVLKKYEKDVDEIIHHDWNIGYCFGVNSWMSKRKLGQHCIQVDQDMLMYSKNWWAMAKIILADEDIGMVAPRRPTAWIDRQDKRDFYKNRINIEQRHGLWLEVPDDNLILTPMMIYKGNVIDEIGFENEATGYDDLDSCYRIKAIGLKSVYIPDIFIYQGLPEGEVCNHHQKGAHYDLMRKTVGTHQKMIHQYMSGGEHFCGTRFLPYTMGDVEYKRLSNENFEFHKNWGER